MPAPIRPIRQHPDTGLLYTLEGNAATIVGCTQLNLTHLVIPPVVTEDGTHYPVTAVGESAFAYQSSLQTLVLPEHLTAIHHGAFEGSGLTEVKLHDGVNVIAPYAFFGCVHLSHLDLPVGVEPAEQAFGDCEALKAENVCNLDSLSDEDIRRAGLPRTQRVAPPPAKPRDELLLEEGLRLEEAGSYADAATAYCEAHSHRTDVSRISDALKQTARMKPIAMAEYRLALLLKFRLAPSKNLDGTPRPTAAELLQRLVDTTDIADAAYHLGDMYTGGYGLPVDRDAAIELLRTAADHGHERACLDLGYVFLRGVQPDLPMAAHYFTKCADMQGPYADVARQELENHPDR